MENTFHFTEDNIIYRTFVLQNGILLYATPYIYGQLVEMMEHIQGTAWGLMSQFLSKLSSISDGAINCLESKYTMKFQNTSVKYGYFKTKS